MLLCDTDTLWYQKKMVDSCYMSIAIFLFLVSDFGRTGRSFLGNVLRLATEEACDTPKNVSIKIAPQVVICNLCCL